jgi:HD-like signal output (HDOD) protein
VLFVDDEPLVLQGLERTFRPMRRDWDMRFADGGPAALAELERQGADLVISDMRMPGMDGGQLLASIMARWPGTIRIILTGQADRDLVHRTIGPAHQFLQKPCDAELLKTTVQRLWRLRASLASEPLRRLVGGMQSVPSLPEIHQELVRALDAPHPSMQAIGALVARDLGLSTRLLQLVGSSFFGHQRRIDDPVEAAAVLGVDVIRALVHTVQAFAVLETGRQAWFDPQQLWNHSARVSRLARQVAIELALPQESVQAASVAGLLHDTGHLLLAAYRPREFAILARRIRDEGDVHGERMALGCTHGEIAAYLLGLWGFPEQTIDAVTWHHQPGLAPAGAPGPTACVHIADAVVNLRDGRMSYNPLNTEWLASQGVPATLEPWKALADGLDGTQS